MWEAQPGSLHGERADPVVRSQPHRKPRAVCARGLAPAGAERRAGPSCSEAGGASARAAASAADVEGDARASSTSSSSSSAAAAADVEGRAASAPEGRAAAGPEGRAAAGPEGRAAAASALSGIVPSPRAGRGRAPATQRALVEAARAHRRSCTARARRQKNGVCREREDANPRGEKRTISHEEGVAEDEPVDTVPSMKVFARVAQRRRFAAAARDCAHVLGAMSPWRAASGVAVFLRRKASAWAKWTSERS